MNRIRAWLLGRRVQQAVDAIKEQAVRPAPVASEANDLQEYLEGDSRQQDAAALRRDRRLCATGQMTIARFRELHPELFLEESPVLTVLSWPEPRFCHHPGAVTEFRVPAPGFRKRRTATGYRLRRNRPDPGAGYLVRRCPDCPAWASAVVPVASSMELTLFPWPIPTTGTTPPDCNGGA